MNGRQAAKAAAKRIEDLEDFNRRCVADIKAYNKCIEGMIAGKCPCDWCEENRTSECTRDEWGNKGCEEWWLMTVLPEQPEEGSDAYADESTGILSAGPTC